MSAQMSKSVLILEDEAIIGLDLAFGVEQAGHGVLGPFAGESDALAAIETARPDAAILDVNLGDGRTSEAVAIRLDALGVPFLFLTGHSSDKIALFQRFPDAPRVAKPCMPDDLLGELDGLMGEDV